MSKVEVTETSDQSPVKTKNGVGNKNKTVKEKNGDSHDNNKAAAAAAADHEKSKGHDSSITNGSSPKKDSSIINGGSGGSSGSEDDETSGSNGDHHNNHNNGGSSQNVTDEDSVLEASPPPPPPPSSSAIRESPRRLVTNVPDYSSSDDDEYNEDDDEEVEEVRDEDELSDSVMEVDPEESRSPEKPKQHIQTKPAAKTNIVTIDDVKTLQSLARKHAAAAAAESEKTNSLLIDTHAILSGKATSGVTITPAKPRVLPLGGTATIGSGVTISATGSNKIFNRSGGNGGLPSGTTMTSLNSSPSSISAASSAAAMAAALSGSSSGFTYDKSAGTLNDPNLTDDTFVVEAPSFIVPYVYEKPPKESFSTFKSSVTKLAEKIKDEGEKNKDKKKSEDDEDDEDESDDEAKEKSKDDSSNAKADNKENDKSPEVTEIKKPAANFFESTLGGFVINLGMNLVQEHVQMDLLREQTRRSQKDKSASVMHAIMSLKKNLEASREKNEGFHFELKKCRFCSFRTESILALESHLETPHLRNGMYRCNFCHFESKTAPDILSHMQNLHAVRAKLERAIPPNQCPQCPFEDNMRGKLTRHKVGCDKRFRPDRNQEPPHDWEPPAKIPKPTQFNRGVGGMRPNLMGAGGNINYHSMTGGMGLSGMAAMNRMGGSSFPGLTAANLASLQQQQQQLLQNRAGAGSAFQGMPNLQFGPRGRGRPVGTYKPGQPMFPQGFRQASPGVGGINRQAGGSLINNQAGRFQQGSSSAAALLNNLGANSSVTIQTISQRSTNPRTGQPSISITPLPGRGGHGTHSSGQARNSPQAANANLGALKPGQPARQGDKAGFVICEICDGYIKDLEQLRNHMQWIHKVKIHPKMIYNRPPLNCQKCQYRFFTDQGLERHLLGSHGLVTASMQELANKGQDSGRCPVCGKVFQWKLLMHVSKDHEKSLKPAHLSYKCTVCTATFGQYKLFENHVYTAHRKSTQGNDKKFGSGQQSSSAGSAASKSPGGLKVSDEVTIIPQGKVSNSVTAAAVVKKNDNMVKPKLTSESDDVIELDDEEDGDEVEERVSPKRSSVSMKKPASNHSPVKKARLAPSSAAADEDSGEEGVEEINDDDE